MCVGGANHEKVGLSQTWSPVACLRALTDNIIVAIYFLFAYIRGCGPFLDYQLLGGYTPPVPTAYRPVSDHDDTV